MFSLSNFIFFFSFILLINPRFSHQSYDSSNCSLSQSQLHGYICSSSKDSDCETYVIYRAQNSFNSIKSIASLFNLSQFDLLKANNLNTDGLRILPVGREIILPVKCQCRSGFFRAPFVYNISSTDSVNSVACEVFEGLVKAQSLVQENPGLLDHKSDSYQITVLIRCACPDAVLKGNGVRYLVTYPIFEGDNPDLIAYKFNLTAKNVTDANSLRRQDAIFPETTLLIPVNNLSDVNWDIGFSPQISPAPKASFKVVSADVDSNWANPRVFLGAGVCFAVVTMIISCRIFRKIRKMNHPERFLPFPVKNSVSSNVSPDFLDGVSKLKNPIIRYSLEDIRIATEDFGEDSVIEKNVYRGRIGRSCLAFERVDSEEVAREVITLLTKINHFNIVRLQGFSNGSNPPFLALEYTGNGSLRNCLSKSETKRRITWTRRLQIAFDLAAALHYLHNSTTPPFVHCNINSTSVLLTIDWRAKLSGFSLAKPVNAAIGAKAADVYAFGIVLLELVSAKEIVVRDDEILIDSISFLLTGSGEGRVPSLEEHDSEKEGAVATKSILQWQEQLQVEKFPAIRGAGVTGRPSLHPRLITGCENFIKNLREFMDPDIDGNCRVEDVICLVLLAKSCIVKDPQNRPTMNDILIALSRII